MKALAALMILEPRACLFCFVGLLKRRCLLKECLLFNLPEPVTSKRLAAAFFVFNFGILIPFQLLELHKSRQAMPFRPNNSNDIFITYFILKFKCFFNILIISVFISGFVEKIA